MEDAPKRQPRLRKRPHDLHRCSSVDALVEALRSRGIDLISLVHEFVKPSLPIGILVTGSIADGVATEVSDLDLMVLLPGADAFKAKRKREIAGNVVNYLPADSPDSNTTIIALFLSGIEIDLVFVADPAVDLAAGFGSAGNDVALEEEEPFYRDPFLNRLATGWVVHGQDVVNRWRAYHHTDKLRVKWIATEFTAVAKTLEDMEAGIGLGRGHISVLGTCAVVHTLSALLAYSQFYCTSPNWMLKINQLLKTADPVMREALTEGVDLAFPALLEAADEEKAYFGRVYEYCGKVKNILAREEGMGDVLASISYDLDLIL
jgi:hypothetical protein